MNTATRTPVPGFGVGRSSDATVAAVPNFVATAMGAVFLLVGVVGFLIPGLFHAHLNWAHNMIHIVTGVLALGAGQLGPLGCARAFNVTFGSVYGLLGVLGFMLGSPAVARVGDLAHDERLWALIPGVLEWGSMDHTIHVLAGLVFFISGIVGYSIRAGTPDRGK